MQPEEVSEIMHTLNERAATKIGWLAITRKNYMGRHDQQTHTTLFNLANPSQGRSGGQKNSNVLARDVDDAAVQGGGGVLGKPKISKTLSSIQDIKLSRNAVIQEIDSRNFTGRQLQQITEKLLTETRKWKNNPNKPEVDADMAIEMAEEALTSVRGAAGSRRGGERTAKKILVVLRDGEGRAVGLASYYKSRTPESNNGAWVVEFLGANPSSGNRAGETIMYHLGRMVQKEVAEGVITLNPLDSARRFYEKIGFLPIHPQLPFMAWEPWRRREFVARVQTRLDAENAAPPSESTKEKGASKMTPELEKYFAELDAIYEKYGCSVGSPSSAKKAASATSSKSLRVLTLKNYAGRHDQQTHTTLFNLANPSQGRRGDDKRAKPVLEKTAGTSPVGRIPVSSPERLVQLRQERRAELGEWRLDNGLSMDRELSSSFDTSSAHAEFANNAFHNAVSAGQIKKEAAHLDPRAVADGKNFEATFKKVVSLETGKFLKEQKFALTDAEKKMTNDFGNINAFRRYLQEKYEDGGGAKLSAFDSRLTAIEKMLSTQMLRVQTWDRVDNRIESRADVDFARNYTDWKGTGNYPNPLRAVSYDGVLNHNNMPAAASIGIARTALVGDPRKSAARQAFERERVEVKAGTDTTNEIIRMATQMGVKKEIIVFAPQPLGSPNRLADYDRRTGLVTFYPRLTNAAGNTRAYIRGVLNHEVNHLKSEEVRVALNNGAKFAKNQEMLRLLTNPEQIYKGLRDNQPLSLSKGKSEVEQTFIGMIRADGITDYSAKFWKDFAMFPSPQTLKRAVDETLAEVSFEATGRGKSERGYINQNWLAASNAMNGAFDSMQVGES